ncbi:MAG: c-type cytochrome, partial [Cyclobacteriaceae bacterium]
EPYKEILIGLVEANEPLPVQLSAFRTLSLVQDETISHLVLKRWESFTPELRDAAINAMLTSKDRINALLDALENGLIQKTNIGWRRSVRLMADKDESIRVRARSIINRPVEESEKIIEAYQEALTFKGSIKEGELVYQKNCAICHKMGENSGLAFGPDLSSLKNRSASNILSEILDPNLSIADGYDLWVVELQNGDIRQGLISSETPTAINLRSAGGMDENISRSDIKTLKVLDMSAMPIGLEQSISKQEMADLLAFIRKSG